MDESRENVDRVTELRKTLHELVRVQGETDYLDLSEQ